VLEGNDRDQPPGAPIRSITAAAAAAPSAPQQGATAFSHPDELTSDVAGGENTIFPQTARTYFATSVDGENWEFPSLGLCTIDGGGDDAQSHSILPQPRGEMLRHAIRDEAEEDPARRYKGLFSMSDRYPAVSADGMVWKLLEDVPRIPSRDTSNFSYDGARKRWLAYVKQPSTTGRAVALSTCGVGPEFGHFSAPKLVLQADEEDAENGRRRKAALLAEDSPYYRPPIADPCEDMMAEIYNMPVLPYEGRYLGFPTLFNPIGAIPPPMTNFTRINQVRSTQGCSVDRWCR
jgi:hypothetical protein